MTTTDQNGTLLSLRSAGISIQIVTEPTDEVFSTVAGAAPDSILTFTAGGDPPHKVYLRAGSIDLIRPAVIG